MPAYPFDPRPIHWNPPRPHRGGSFRGEGKLVQHGAHVNPSLWDTDRTTVGRLVVGFNVGGEPRWTMDDLIEIVRRVRTEQVGNPESSFVAQRGIYQHRDGSGVVTEDGAQVFIIDTSGKKKRKFRKQMMELAETIARDLEQETVILEIQVNGISQGTTGVGP